MLMPFSGNPGEQRHTHDLLVSKTEACAVGQLLGRLDGQVRTYGPVQSKNHSHDNQKRRIVCQKSRQSEQDQPVSGRRLLYLYVSCGEQRTKLRDFAETHQHDIDDKRQQQKNHNL